VIIGIILALIGVFKINGAVKSGEINIRKTTKKLGHGKLFVIFAAVAVIIGAALVIFGLMEMVSAISEAADDTNAAFETFKDGANMMIFGIVLISFGILMVFLGVGFTMMGLSYACFDEYQSKIQTKVLIGVVLIVLSLILSLVGATIFMSAVSDLDEDSTDEELTDASNSASMYTGLSSLMTLIGAIFIIWSCTTTSHGLKQVVQEHKRRAAGW